MRYFFLLLFVTTFFSCNEGANHIDRYKVDIGQLKTLPDNFYAFRRGRLYTASDDYMIWYNKDWNGNIANVLNIIDINNHEGSTADAIRKFNIDTISEKETAQHFIDLSRKFKFGHIKIDHKNKIAFSYRDGLNEQYVMPLNDSIKAVYSKNHDFVLLPNKWFENKETHR